VRPDCPTDGVTPSSATAATDQDSGAVVPTYLCAYESQKQSRRERRRFGQARNRLERIPVAALHQWTRADLDRHASRADVDRRAALIDDRRCATRCAIFFHDAQRR